MRTSTLETDGRLLPQLVVLSLRNPREAAARIIALDLPRDTLWQSLGLVAVLTVMLTSSMLLFVLQPALARLESVPPHFEIFVQMGQQPMRMGFEQLCFMVLMVFAVHWVGRSFGGEGGLSGAIAVVAWSQFLFLCLLIALILATAIVTAIHPALGALMILPFGFLVLWLLAQFICALHGFENVLPVIGMILVTFMVFNVFLSILVATLSVMVGGPSNV